MPPYCFLHNCNPLHLHSPSARNLWREKFFLSLCVVSYVICTVYKFSQYSLFPSPSFLSFSHSEFHIPQTSPNTGNMSQVRKERRDIPQWTMYTTCLGICSGFSTATVNIVFTCTIWDEICVRCHQGFILIIHGLFVDQFLFFQKEINDFRWKHRLACVVQSYMDNVNCTHYCNTVMLAANITLKPKCL